MLAPPGPIGSIGRLGRGSPGVASVLGGLASGGSVLGGSCGGGSVLGADADGLVPAAGGVGYGRAPWRRARVLCVCRNGGGDVEHRIASRTAPHLARRRIRQPELPATSRTREPDSHGWVLPDG